MQTGGDDEAILIRIVYYCTLLEVSLMCIIPSHRRQVDIPAPHL